MNKISTTQVMQLVNERNTGNKTSENQLRDLLKTPMLQVCLKMCPSLKDAEKVLAEGMTRVFSNLSGYDGRQSFGAWCRSHFVSTAIEYVLYMSEEITGTVHNMNALRKVA